MCSHDHEHTHADGVTHTHPHIHDHDHCHEHTHDHDHGHEHTHAQHSPEEALALLGKTLAVISGTMTALTVAGWAITRANEKKREKE